MFSVKRAGRECFRKHCSLMVNVLYCRTESLWVEAILHLYLEKLLHTQQLYYKWLPDLSKKTEKEGCGQLSACYALDMISELNIVCPLQLLLGLPFSWINNCSYWYGINSSFLNTSKIWLIVFPICISDLDVSSDIWPGLKTQMLKRVYENIK